MPDSATLTGFPMSHTLLAVSLTICINVASESVSIALEMLVIVVLLHGLGKNVHGPAAVKGSPVVERYD